jgi:hypothetical protein
MIREAAEIRVWCCLLRFSVGRPVKGRDGGLPRSPPASIAADKSG